MTPSAEMGAGEREPGRPAGGGEAGDGPGGGGREGPDAAGDPGPDLDEVGAPADRDTGGRELPARSEVDEAVARAPAERETGGGQLPARPEVDEAVARAPAERATGGGELPVRPEVDEAVARAPAERATGAGDAPRGSPFDDAAASAGRDLSRPGADVVVGRVAVGSELGAGSPPAPERVETAAATAATPSDGAAGQVAGGRVDEERLALGGLGASVGTERDRRAADDHLDMGRAPDVPGGRPPADDRSAVLDHPDVTAAMQRAWDRSEPGDYDRRHEEGGWIVTSASGEARVVDVAPGWRDGIRPGAPPPVGEGERVAAFFHTHPNPPVDEAGTTWVAGHSDADVRWSDATGIPCVVRNADGVSVYRPGAGEWR